MDKLRIEMNLGHNCCKEQEGVVVRPREESLFIEGIENIIKTEAQGETQDAKCSMREDGAEV